MIRITGHLQLRAKTPDKVGITLELTNNKKPYDLVIHSFWEDEIEIPSSNQSSDKSEIALQQRYMSLLPVVMRWLILECYKIKEEIRISRINFGIFTMPKRRQKEMAGLYYTLGILCYVSKRDFQKDLSMQSDQKDPSTQSAQKDPGMHSAQRDSNTHIAQKDFFFQAAIKYLLQASKIRPGWCLPYLFRANIYGDEMGANLQSLERDALRQKALDLYDLAFDCKDTQEGKDAKKNKEHIENRHRVILARALTKLHSDVGEPFIEEVDRELEVMKNEQDPADFNWKRLDCVAYLYDLATCYALVYNNVHREKPEARKEARLYLVYSLFRAQGPRHWVEEDENFAAMRLEGDWKALKEVLSKELRENPGLLQLQGSKLKTEINKILEEVNQKVPAL